MGMPHIEDALTPRATAFFQAITASPRLVIILSLLAAVVMALGVPRIVRDTTVDAFMPEGHPAILYRDQVEEVFGLRDPIVIAVIRDKEGGIYTPDTLALVDRLTRDLKKIPNVDPERVRSLATEKNIEGTDEGLQITPFLDPLPTTPDAARAVRPVVETNPLYLGTLVAEDGSATLITAELVDQQIAGQTYEVVEDLVAAHELEGVRLLIAGEGAVGGYLSIYINTDARRVQPTIFAIIIVMMVIGFRSWLSFFTPIVIVAATVGGAMGIMGYAGIPYYIITAALPIILIAAAVADSIHILSRYYEELAMDPGTDQRTIVVRTMAVMWRPVVLTSLTTMAGFTGIAITSNMPPMFWFGTFATLGTLLALIYSLIFLPAALCLFKPRPSPAFRPNARGESGDVIGRAMGALGLLALHHGRLVILASIALVGVGAWSALSVPIDRSRIENFAPSAPIFQAHHEINKRFHGTGYFDFVVETPEAEGLFDPARLKRVEALQTYLEAQPGIGGTISIVDYLKQMHKAMNGNDPAFYRLPDDPDLTAQYFLLYAAMGGPTDFQEEIDYSYQTALVRAMVPSSRYATDRPMVETVAEHVARSFTDEDLTVTLSGRINVDYHWMEPLARNHFLSIAVSLTLVFIVSALLFRSVIGGLYTLAPVIVSVLAVYAIMGALKIPLEPSTSMFAAIAIGLGVDFSIHVLDRIRFLVQTQGLEMQEAIRGLYRTAGRALFINFAALFLGFSATFLSEMPPLTRLGAMVATATLLSFVASIMIVPALVSVLRPGFLGLKTKAS